VLTELLGLPDYLDLQVLLEPKGRLVQSELLEPLAKKDLSEQLVV